MKVCPNCRNVVSYNSYFGAYICNNCEWEDASVAQKRRFIGLGYKGQLSTSKSSKVKHMSFAKTGILK